MIYQDEKGPSVLYIKNESEEYFYPLQESKKIINIEGSLGLTRIQIKDNKAKVISSPCIDKTCIHFGNIQKKGEWNACLPNKVFLRIIGKGEEIDSISY
jgi:hypothetical protein